MNKNKMLCIVPSNHMKATPKAINIRNQSVKPAPIAESRIDQFFLLLVSSSTEISIVDFFFHLNTSSGEIVF